MKNLIAEKLENKEKKKFETSKGNVDMADSESQIQGVKKLNEALLEVIVDLQKQEFISDQEVIQSRAFNRLLRNGHQLLQAHEELMQENKSLEKQLAQQTDENRKSLDTCKRNFDESVSKFQSQLQTNAIQMKISQIEKDNMQKELDKFKSINIEELKKNYEEMKRMIEVMEGESKKVKDNLQEALKDKKSISDRMNQLRLEYDNFLNSAKKGETELEDQEIIDGQRKQIKDLIEESNGFKIQLNDLYSDMEAIYQANQELENKNKLCNSKIENSNKLVEKSREETFKLAMESGKCKDEVKLK